MAHNNVRNPPSLQDSTSYENWEKSLKFWQLLTSVPKEKQGAAIVLSLTGKAKEAVLELSEQIGNQIVFLNLHLVNHCDRIPLLESQPCHLFKWGMETSHGK